MIDLNTHSPDKYSEILCDRNVKLTHSSSVEFETAEVLIAITHKNQCVELSRALKSSLKQTLIKNNIARIVVLDDSSNTLWSSETQALLNHPSVTLLSAECGSPARARNCLLDWADAKPNLQWVARLDADDELFGADSLECLWDTVRRSKKKAALGSNKLRKNGLFLPEDNIADPNILNSHSKLSEFIEGFASGGQKQEIPSCNLLLRTNIGIRYPNSKSAEDHWLVTRLLILHSADIEVCPSPIYSIYSLDGSDTKQNRSTTAWQDQRSRLAYVSRKWCELLATERYLLGVGMEGVVWLQHNQVVKEFYPWAISDEDVARLKPLLSDKSLPIPQVRWRKCNELWRYQTDYIDASAPEQKITKYAIVHYLKKLYRAGVSTLNIKRENLIVNSHGELLYIDIGKDIKPLTTSYFRDMCARLYSIGILGNKDEELVRRKSWRRQDDALKALTGFEGFYSELLALLHPQCNTVSCIPIDNTSFTNDSVTLLIKACGQDAGVIKEQVTHIVSQLSYPINFHKKILLIDPNQDAFLRQYADENLTSVMKQAKDLQIAGVIDSIIIAPTDLKKIATTYEKWFSQSNCIKTHTVSNAPVFPQIWGFDQVTTPYVLQCDLDILIGRRNWEHDYLADMLYACEPEDVLSVGFNIPKSQNNFNPYYGEPGEFAPEVRCGLLNLSRIYNQLPIDNPQLDDQLTLTWHRSLQGMMSKRALRSVRGGDSDSYYVHPRNEHKHLSQITLVRDLIAQGKEPKQQQEQFDWIPGKHWKYESREEAIVFLLKGRLIKHPLLKRCIDSLKKQVNQNFGVILIDDASGSIHNWCYPILLGELRTKTTLVRHKAHKGRMPNFLLAIKEICQVPDTLVAVLDQDDCLMQANVVDMLLAAKREGADLIQMPMYRPNKPLNLYQPDYTNSRLAAGANVWSHLRVFTKELFEQVPESYFKVKDSGEWFDTVTDYLTMLPMVELAKNAVYLDSGYIYWHLRKNYGDEERERENLLIRELLSKPSLTKK